MHCIICPSAVLLDSAFPQKCCLGAHPPLHPVSERRVRNLYIAISISYVFEITYVYYCTVLDFLWVSEHFTLLQTLYIPL